MPWPPRIGDPLPRPADVWFERSKLDWILSAEGHGSEWGRVFCIGPGDWELIWKAIAEATLGSTIQVVRNRAPFGVACGIGVDLTINQRGAPVTVSWHYAFTGAPPRLVTAYPSF